MVKSKVDSLERKALIEINEKFSNKGIRSHGELDHIIYRVGRARGINQKAATMMVEIIRRHPFVDGNKRTGFESTLALLEANGKHLEVGDTSKMNVVFWITRPKTKIEDIAMWIANHTR